MVGKVSAVGGVMHFIKNIKFEGFSIEIALSVIMTACILFFTIGLLTGTAKENTESPKVEKGIQFQ